MAIEGVSIIEYQIDYPTLSLQALKDNEMVFEWGMLYCYTKECDKGFKVKKINKTTRKGTRFTYIALKSEDDIKEYKKVLEEMLARFLAKYNAKLKNQ